MHFAFEKLIWYSSYATEPFRGWDRWKTFSSLWITFAIKRSLLLILGDKVSITLGLYEGQPLVQKGKGKYLFAPSSVHGYQQAIWVARRTYELGSPLAITLDDGRVFPREGFLEVIVIF